MDDMTSSIGDSGEGHYWHHDPDAAFGGLRVVGVGRRIEQRGGRQFVDRTLDRLSLSLVLKGSGTFIDERAATSFRAGDLLILMPGEHHRYASTDDSGWEAIWCFLDIGRGFLRDSALRGGPLRVGLGSRAARCFRDLLRRARDPVTPRRLLVPPALELLVECSLQLRPPASGVDDPVDLAIAALRASPQRDWDLPLLAEQHGISYSLLRQRMRKRTGLAPQRFLQALRCDRACDLLAHEGTVQGIARAVGFADPFHFSRVFRRVVGCSPSAFRASLR